MIAGLQAAFILFHNNAVDRVRRAEPRHRARAGRSREARRLTTWHYQWLIVNEFLPLFVGQDGSTRRCATAGASTGRDRPGVHPGRVPERLLPLRPQHGAAVVPGEPRRQRRRHGVLRDDLRPGGRGPARSGRPARRRPRAAALHRLGDVLRVRRRQTSGRTRRSTRSISTPLFNLPLGAIASGDPPTSLPQRNLLRGI